MTNINVEHMRRILPVVLAAGETEVVFSLTWSLAGNVVEFNEPELTVLEARVSALAGEICVTFEIQQDTYYVAEDTGLVEKATTSHQLTTLVQVPGSKPGDRVSIETEAGLQGSWRPEPLTVRQNAATLFKGDCKLTMKYAVVEEQEVAFLKPSGLDGEVMSETVDVESIHGRFEQAEDVAIPVEFGVVPRSVGQITAKLTNIKVSSMCGWVRVEGDIIATVPYLGSEELAAEETFVSSVKYFVEVAGAKGEMSADCSGQVSIFTCLRESGEKTGTLRGLLLINGSLTSVEPLEMTIRSRSHESFTHNYYEKHHGQHQKNKPFLLEEVIGVGSSQTLIQRELFFSRKVRRVREPVDAQVRNLHHEIIPNKVIVKGVLRKQLFVVDADTGVVFAHDVDESFVHFVDVPGASPGMRAHVQSRVEFVKVEIHPGGETARQVTIIEIKVKVTRAVKKEIVACPVVLPTAPFKPPSHFPTSRTYVVRSGDSIWKIANMFGVSMESIIRANNLQNPNLIFPGQQLIIPR